MILKLSVGEAVQISYIVKMRLGSQKGDDHTAVFMCSDLNESQDTCRMVLSCLPLEEGERKGTLPLAADPEHTHSWKRGHARIKNQSEGN